jgi:multicomponent Na+:H+ antiporter subunit B
VGKRIARTRTRRGIAAIATLFIFLLLAFMLITAIFVALSRDLMAVVMVFGAYSLLSAGMFMVMDAPDVAFTEAAVGAGVSTLLMLMALSKTGRFERRAGRQWLPLGLTLVTTAVLVYGTLDMPRVGHPENPAHQHVAPRYLQESGQEIGIPNVVTSVLASYRGFDTFGEVVVVFTAGLGVWLLIGGIRRKGGG